MNDVFMRENVIGLYDWVLSWEMKSLNVVFCVKLWFIGVFGMRDYFYRLDIVFFRIIGYVLVGKDFCI